MLEIVPKRLLYKIIDGKAEQILIVLSFYVEKLIFCNVMNRPLLSASDDQCSLVASAILKNKLLLITELLYVETHSNETSYNFGYGLAPP